MMQKRFISKFSSSLVFLFYFTRINYGDFGLKKSISACIIVQKQMSKDMTDKKAREICEREIKKNK